MLQALLIIDIFRAHQQIKFEELKEMYDMIGQGALIGNIGNFLPDWYSSSSDYINTSHNTAWGVYFNTSEFYDVNRTHPSNVRPIRSF